MIEVVAGVIYKNNKFLIAQRNLKKAQGGLWEFPGGKVEKNESYESALIREIKEEIGIDVDKKDILFIGASTSINVNKEKDILNKHFNEYYIVNKDIDVSSLTLQTEEVSDAKWFEKDDIINRINNNFDGITDKEGCWEYLKKYYEWKENSN